MRAGRHPVGSVALALALAGVALVLGGCATAAPPTEAGCPDGLLDAVERGGVIAGTPGAIADVVSPTALEAPATAALLHGCVIRVRYTYRRDTPVSFEAFTPGGGAIAAGITSSLRRDGWAAVDGPTTVFRGPDGGTATVDAYPAGRFPTLLPSGYRLPDDSPYRRSPVVVLGLTTERRSAVSAAASGGRGCPAGVVERVASVTPKPVHVQLGGPGDLGSPLADETELANACVLVVRTEESESVIAILPLPRDRAAVVDLRTALAKTFPTLAVGDSEIYGTDSDRWSITTDDSGTPTPGLEGLFFGPTLTVIHATDV